MGTWTKLNAGSLWQNRCFHSYFISSSISKDGNCFCYELQKHVDMVFPGICGA